LSGLRSVEEILGARRIVVAANGLDFEVFEAGEGDRLALLLHGFPQSALEWRHQIPTLLAKGFRVWAVNQRGYRGTSRPPRREDYRLANLLADIAALIDASGARSTVLIGHDWGGLLAFAFAARGLRPLERLVALNAPHPRRFAKALQTPAQRRRSRYVKLFRLPWLPDWLLSLRGGALIAWMFRETARKGAFDDDIIAIYRADACRPGALTAMLDWYRAAAPEIFATEEPAAPIETPTLMIWGERDVALDLCCLEGTGLYVKNLRVERLPRVTHWTPEDGAREVNALLADWL
jgi:pimeloyl-ACP methyl ester carboxylesterase